MLAAALLAAAALLFYVVRKATAVRIASPEVGTAVHATDWQTAYDLPALPRRSAGPAAPRRWRAVKVPDLAAAERLFDTLEREGVAERELVVRGRGPITVRWRG